jgi:hypothetical protein
MPTSVIRQSIGFNDWVNNCFVTASYIWSNWSNIFILIDINQILSSLFGYGQNQSGIKKKK